MYQFREERAEERFEAQDGGPGSPAVALVPAQILADPEPAPHFPKTSRISLAARREQLARSWAAIDWAPDLGSEIGSRRWARGLASFVALTALSLSFWPGLAPLEAAPPARLTANERDLYRTNGYAPLAYGGDSGMRMAANALVRPLAAAPERPRVELVATLARGDSFAGFLQRAGVGAGDAANVAALIGGAVAAGEIAPGTPVDIVLGRRTQSGAARPLESLAFRARFDLALEVTRGEGGGGLALVRKPIRVDATPLRVRGTVGDSLYRSARAAGAPAGAVQAYLKALNDQYDLSRELAPTDTFDLIVAHRRAATGERQAGELLFAGVERAGKPRAQLMRWGKDGQFFEASGVGEQRSGLLSPVQGPIGSRFGLRRHPILGYTRLHAGLDFRAGYGAPIVAVTDGVVLSAGRAGGCGIAVKLGHGGGIQTRYCHMSRMAVSPGQGVRRGQVIGYVGSTGLSTGAHLHYEMYRGGRAVDPASVRYVTRAQLEGAQLVAFRAALAKLKTVEAGAALASLSPTPAESAAKEPAREIDRLDSKPAQR